MSKSSSGCLSVFLGLILFVSLVLNVILVSSHSMRPKSAAKKSHTGLTQEYVAGNSDSNDKLALVELRGVISSEIPGVYGDSMVDDLAWQLKEAVADEEVKGIILRIDSPGGEVNASDIIYHEVTKARAKKPVTVYMESVAASGGYYSAIGGSHIMASELTITGSIGVIMQTFNFKDLLDKIGVRAMTFKSGKMKDLLNPTREITAEEQMMVQDLINETYDKFVGLVAKERKMDEAFLRKELADGRILSGLKAKEAGLIDSTGYFEDAIRQAEKTADIKDAEVIRYHAPFNFDRFMRTLGNAPLQKIKVQVGPSELQPGLPVVSGKLYYLSTHLFIGN